MIKILSLKFIKRNGFLLWLNIFNNWENLIKLIFFTVIKIEELQVNKTDFDLLILPE